jgi:type IV pilus assembly protein PilB
MSRLGELLVREKLISLQQLQKAQEEAKRSGKRLGHALAQLGFVKDQDLTSFLAKQYSLPSINLDDFEIDADVLKLIPKDVARKHMIMPVNRAGSTLIVAMSDPSNIYAIDELKFLTQYNIEPVVSTESAIEEAIQRYYERAPDLTELVGEFEDGEIDFTGEEREDINVVDLEKQSGEAPVVKLCNMIMLAAIKKKASDIHIEPYEKEFRIRYRIDGILYEEMKPPKKLQNAILSRVKIMASLDISERRLPQDGRIKLKIGKDKEMDFRVSVLPTLFGEKIVLRLLDKAQLQLDMTKLGFEERQLVDSRRRSPCPTAWSSSPARPGRARRPRSTPRCRS